MLKKIRIVLWLLSLIALGILVFVMLQARYGSTTIDSPADDIIGIFVEPAQPIPEATLQSADGDWTTSDLEGDWSVLFFGFTHCPDICPAAMQLMMLAFEDVKTKVDPATFDQLKGYLVSVDPYRDTPENLQSYVSFYSEKFTGLTADLSEIDKLAKKFGVFYEFPEGTDTTTNYNVAHSGQFVLVNPEGEFQAALTEHTNFKIVANDIVNIIDYWDQVNQ